MANEPMQLPEVPEPRRRSWWYYARLSGAAYFLTYILLTCFGSFAPAVWGLNGVKWYSWAPYGFVDAGLRRNGTLHLVFAPLYLADVNLWHTEGAMGSKRYPVRWAPGERAWF